MKNVYGWDKILINPRGRYSVTFQNLFTIIKFEFLIKLGIYRTFLKNFKQNILHTSFITYIILSSITITFIPKNCNLKSLPFSINNTFLLNLSRIFLPHFHHSTILNTTASSQLHHSTLSSAITPSSKIPTKTIPTFSCIFFQLPSSTSKKDTFHSFTNTRHSPHQYPSSKTPIKTFSFHPPSQKNSKLETLPASSQTRIKVLREESSKLGRNVVTHASSRNSPTSRDIRQGFTSARCNDDTR